MLIRDRGYDSRTQMQWTCQYFHEFAKKLSEQVKESEMAKGFDIMSF